MPGLRVLFRGRTGVISSAYEDRARQRIDAGVDAVTDKLAQAFRPGA